MSQFIRDKPPKDKKNRSSWSNLGNGEYDEDDQEFVVSDNAAMDSSSSNSTSSDNLERLSTAEFKQRKRFRKKIKRRHGSEDGSESDKKYSEQSEKSESSDEAPLNRSASKMAQSNVKRKELETTSEEEENHNLPSRRSRRIRKRRPKKAKIEEDDDTKINLRSSSDEREPIDFESQKLEDLTTKPVKRAQVKLKRIRLTREEMKSGYVLTKARVKHADASDSPDGDSEPEQPEVKQEPAVSSDESDVDARVAKKKRIAKIVESDESNDEKPTEKLESPWIHKPRSELPRSFRDTSSSSDDLDGDLSDGFVVTDEESQHLVKRERNSSASSDTDVEPQNKSILSQLAPEMLSNLKNRTTLTKSGFEAICKLYIQDNLNSKSIDGVYTCKPGMAAGFDEEASDVRKALGKMDSSLADAESKCVTGAWQPVLKYRLNIHPCITEQKLQFSKWHCALCNRRRKCSESVILWGRDYNRTTLRMTKTELEYDPTEGEAGLRQVTGEDGSSAIEFYIGPQCSKRLHLYHEMHHYKVQLYQTLSEEYDHLSESAKWKRKLENATKGVKNRIIGEDLITLTDEIFEILREGTITISFTHFQSLLSRAAEIDMQMSYGQKE